MGSKEYKPRSICVGDLVEWSIINPMFTDPGTVVKVAYHGKGSRDLKQFGMPTHATVIWRPDSKSKITATWVPCGSLRVVTVLKEDPPFMINDIAAPGAGEEA